MTESVQDTLSLRGYRWVFPQVSDTAVMDMMSAHPGLSETVSRILLSRDIQREDIEDFLNPRLKTQIPDPSVLKDMDLGVERLVKAIQHGEHITLWGDYDVDGATSTALLYLFLSAHTPHVNFYIPDRFAEGYGPNVPAFQKLIDQGTQVIVTMDCGSTSYPALNEAAQRGVDVVVIDHHGLDAAQPMPPAYAMINPQRADDQSQLKSLAAVGLTFLFAVSLNRALRQYPELYKNFPLMSLLDLVALGTVCDVVPLKGLNRVFVAQGLKVMAKTTHVGLRALQKVAGLECANTTYHCGFVLGPRINAGGRIGDPSLGVRLLIENDPSQAQRRAEQLDQHNSERQAIEKYVLQSALEHISPQDPVCIVGGEEWHEGVIGIVAGRLKERCQKPALVISWDAKTGFGKGSGRSVPGWDLGQAIREAVQKGHLEKGGGHPMAAGFSLHRDQESAFIEGMQSHYQNHAQPLALTCSLEGWVHQPSLCLKFIEDIESLGPFGPQHPQPRFAFSGLRVRYAQVVGQSHIRCDFEPYQGLPLGGIAFRAADEAWGQYLLKAPSQPDQRWSFAGTVAINTWQGQKKLQIQIEDMAHAA